MCERVSPPLIPPWGRRLGCCLKHPARLVVWLCICGWWAAASVAAAEDPIDHADEILFRVNQVTVTRSQVELEFLAQAPIERLAQPNLPAAERRALIAQTWQNAVREVVAGAVLQAQSREEFDYLDFVARIEPKVLNDAVDHGLQQLELRYGGAQPLDRQMQRFHIDRKQLRQRMVISFGIEMFLARKFSTLSRSTPDQQRAYYREHPLEFALSGRVRLQRLAVRFLPGPEQTPQQIAAGIDKIAQAWQASADPAGFANSPAYLAPWTVLTAATDDDWIAFDKLPDALREAARQPQGTVLAPITVAEFRRQQGFQADGPAPLRPAPAADQQGDAVLLFRIAEQKVVLQPYDQVVGDIRARLDADIFRAAKVEFLARIRKNTLVTATAGDLPAISPWLLQLQFAGEAAPAKDPPPAELNAPAEGLRQP